MFGFRFLGCLIGGSRVGSRGPSFTTLFLLYLRGQNCQQVPENLSAPEEAAGSADIILTSSPKCLRPRTVCQSRRALRSQGQRSWERGGTFKRPWRGWERIGWRRWRLFQGVARTRMQKILFRKINSPHPSLLLSILANWNFILGLEPRREHRPP